jgi:hypothetical protein
VAVVAVVVMLLPTRPRREMVKLPTVDAQLAAA